MALSINFTPNAVAEGVGQSAAGEMALIVAVKATYGWDKSGSLRALPPQPVVKADEYVGDPATSGLRRAGELGMPKPRVDVLLAGSLRFVVPLSETDVALAVGNRLLKRARVFGPRRWIPGVVRDVAATAPALMETLPLEWERSSGGTNRDEGKRVDRRNPVGVANSKDPRQLVGQPLPQFEDLDDLSQPGRLPKAPIGFSALAPHWKPRSDFAGTYDEAWRATVSPALPTNFDPRFFNAAPEDQQLDDYLPGEVVQLMNMSADRVVRFALPTFSVPITFVTRHLVEETEARVDTIVIEPAEQRVSMVARSVCVPTPSLAVIRSVHVGEPTPACKKALALGKVFVDLGARSRGHFI